ncbi:MAG: cyclic nucleotide-binding domain-containing protein [Candidatus Firestonebacteria bacterium]
MYDQERRKYQRINITLPVGVMVKDLGGRFFVGNTINIGGSGLSMIINTFLPVGTLVSLTFEFQEDCRFENIEGKVTRSKEEEDKFFSAIAFDDTNVEVKEKISKYIKSVIFLRKIKPFKDLLDEESWYIRKISKEVSYREGQKIFEDGMEGNAFYIVISGRVKIVKKSIANKEEVLVLIREGEFFGEMALLDESERCASAVAFDNVEMFVMKREDFRQLLSSNDSLAVKLLWVFIATLCRRLRAVDKRMADSFFTETGTLTDLVK